MKGMLTMKKRLIAVSNILFAIAAVLALITGINMNSMLDLSRDFVSEAFPVNYDVKFVGKNSAVISDAEVYFNNGKAFISSESFNGSINADDAIFTCTSSEAFSKNIVRSGMLFSIITVLNIAAISVPVVMGANLRSRAAKIRRRKTVRLECVSSNQHSSMAVSAAA